MRMSQQIDSCPSCSAPIFDTDGVSGACACNEGIYSTLIARQRLENRRGHVRTASTGMDHALVLMARQGAPEPALDSRMFLSSMAQREVEAAQQERFHPSPQPGRGRPTAIMDDVPEGIWDLTLEDAPQPSSGIDFEFSNGEDIDIPQGPMPSGRQERFRVDRPLPVREPFNAQRVHGPQGGPMREVARVGRFPLLREEGLGIPQPTQVQEVFEPVTREVDAPSWRAPTAQQLNTLQQEKRAAIHVTLPTAYERIAGDFLSDADDFD